MSPSPDFYQRIASGQDAELASEVETWKKAEFAQGNFLCRVKTRDGKILYGVLEPSGYCLGEASLDIQIKLDSGFPLESSVRKGVVDKNTTQLGKDPDETFKKLGLELGKKYRQIKFSTVGWRNNFAFHFKRNVFTSQEPWREVDWSKSRAGAVPSAMGFAANFEQTFPGWKVIPLAPTELQKS